MGGGGGGGGEREISEKQSAKLMRNRHFPTGNLNTRRHLKIKKKKTCILRI